MRQLGAEALHGRPLPGQSGSLLREPAQQPLLGADTVPGLVDGEGALWPTVPEVIAHATADEVDAEIHRSYQALCNRDLPTAIRVDVQGAVSVGDRPLL